MGNTQHRFDLVRYSPARRKTHHAEDSRLLDRIAALQKSKAVRCEVSVFVVVAPGASWGGTSLALMSTGSSFCCHTVVAVGRIPGFQLRTRL